MIIAARDNIALGLCAEYVVVMTVPCFANAAASARSDGSGVLAKERLQIGGASLCSGLVRLNLCRVAELDIALLGRCEPPMRVEAVLRRGQISS